MRIKDLSVRYDPVNIWFGRHRTAVKMWRKGEGI